MKVMLTGYGRMGREIEEVLLGRGHTITARVDIAEGIGDYNDVTPSLLTGCDMVIEFSLASAVKPHVQAYSEAGVPVVIGTTGWEDERNTIRDIVAKTGGALLWGANFSIGAHILFALASQASKIIEPLEEYDIFVHEIHHTGKKDSPSGTALTLAEKILNGNVRKNKIATEAFHRQIEPNELHVSSTRGGSVPGIHSVFLDSAADTVEIKHTARSRKGFALGAVKAAEWLIGKKGFFQVEDFINDLI